MKKTTFCIGVLAALAISATALADDNTTVKNVSIKCGNDYIADTKDANADEYLWYKDGQPYPGNTARIVVTVDGDVTYTCQAIKKTISIENNLMANGSFENNPPTNFSSDYTYAGWDPQQYYNSHGGASNLYAITHDASYFWKNFYAVKPHGGQYFALFDAGTDGFAWKATTAQNPNLIIQKDSVYLFSYYVAYPNKDANQSPARLKFVVQVNGKEYPLGNVYTVGTGANPMNAWVLQQVTWKAPVSSNNVLIGVYDENKDSGGNDFCLDDIMFQKTTAAVREVVHTYVFNITSDCAVEPEPEPCIEIGYRKWEDVIFIPNPDSLYTAYQWYKDGQIIPGATEQFYHNPAGLSGTYHCVITAPQGTFESCPKAFDLLPRSADDNPGIMPAIAKTSIYHIGPHISIFQTIYEDGSVKTDKRIVWETY